MVSLIDSKAQFNQRLNECSITQSLQRALKNAGIDTLSTLAYSHGQPGQTIDDDRFSAWVKGLDNTVTIGAVASLKRLLFESQTQLLALLKEQVTRPEEYVGKKMPQAEREARLTNLKTRLIGQLIEGSTEPGHCLLDLAVQMHEKNQTVYLSPDRCVSRLHELTATKSNDKMIEIEASRLVIKDKEPDLEVSASTSLQVLESLRRRGLALDFAEVMSFAEHKKLQLQSLGHCRLSWDLLGGLGRKGNECKGNLVRLQGSQQCVIQWFHTLGIATWFDIVTDHTFPRLAIG